MSVSVLNLSKKYAQQKAVDNISFEVKKGEILGFLGPNGAGKSTTMKMLTCYLPPSSGTASIDGMDIIQQPLEVRRKIGYLPENNPLYYDMYVKEFLEFAYRIYGQQSSNKIQQTIKETIDLVGLGLEQHKKIGQLSKGYKQRVGIAQALIHQPEVLILDEPTSGLDPNQLADIRNLIKELGKEKTIIFSTHRMENVEEICEEIFLINKGKIILEGNVQAIKQQYKKHLIKVEISASSIINESIQQQTNMVEQTSTYLIFKLKEAQTPNDILKILLQNNIEIAGMTEILPTVNEIFIQAVKEKI